MDVAVGVGRAVVEHEFRPALGGRAQPAHRGRAVCQRAKSSGSFCGRPARIGKSVFGQKQSLAVVAAASVMRSIWLGSRLKASAFVNRSRSCGCRKGSSDCRRVRGNGRRVERSRDRVACADMAIACDARAGRAAPGGTAEACLWTYIRAPGAKPACALVISDPQPLASVRRRCGRRPPRRRRSASSSCSSAPASMSAAPILLPVLAAALIAHDARAADEARPSARRVALADRACLCRADGGGRWPLVTLLAGAGQRMDRPRAGDRRQHQAEALRARPAAGGVARTAELAAVGSDSRVAVKTPRSAWSRRCSPSSRRPSASSVIFFATLISFSSARWSCAILVVVLRRPRRQAALHRASSTTSSRTSPPI